MSRQEAWVVLFLAISGSSAACSSRSANFCFDGASPDGGPVITGSASCPGELDGDFRGKCDEFKLGLSCPAGDGPACRCRCEQCGASKAWICVDLEPNAGCAEE